MTILDAYAPEEFDVNAEKEYQFTFPAVDNDSVEVYEIILEDGIEYQYLVPIQDYTLRWDDTNLRYPLLDRGKVTFDREHSVGCVRVRIVRNTLIDQTIDMPVYGAFNSRMVEFGLDKATMIAQEIADRKCNATTVTPITQEIVFGAYDFFPAKNLNFAVEKLYDILAEIKASADDCTDNLEGA